MQFPTRRAAIKSAGSVAIAYLSPSFASSRSDGTTLFMIDAVSELRAGLGMSVHRTSKGDPTWNPRLEFKLGDNLVGEGLLSSSSSEAVSKRPSSAERAGDQDYDPRILQPDSKVPELLGSVGIPVAFADFDFWYLSGGIHWYPNSGQKLPEVHVPHGFCTDLATIPQFFWSFGLPKIGRYAYAAIIHDFLYWQQTVATREQADEILYSAMVDSGVSAISREAISFAVAKIPFFAQNAWDTNTALKKSGAKRILKVTPPPDKMTSWADWSKDPSNFSDWPPNVTDPVKR